MSERGFRWLVVYCYNKIRKNASEMLKLWKKYKDFDIVCCGREREIIEERRENFYKTFKKLEIRVNTGFSHGNLRTFSFQIKYFIALSRIGDRQRDSCSDVSFWNQKHFQGLIQMVKILLAKNYCSYWCYRSYIREKLETEHQTRNWVFIGRETRK